MPKGDVIEIELTLGIRLPVAYRVYEDHLEIVLPAGYPQYRLKDLSAAMFLRFDPPH
jgi:hypothetical protein